METLDISPLKETGKPLKLAIINAVRATQTLMPRPLPSELIMTKAQFKDLNTDPDLSYFQETMNKEFLYVTPLCVMEVRVK